MSRRVLGLRFVCLLGSSQLCIVLLHLELLAYLYLGVSEHEVAQLLLLLLQELFVRPLQRLGTIFHFIFSREHAFVKVPEVLLLLEAADLPEQLALLHSILGPILWPHVAFERFFCLFLEAL